MDMPGEKVAAWLVSLTDHFPQALWVLLEQMHRFDFQGPEKATVSGMLTREAIAEYGLRGRLFWESGQIQWRRLDDGVFRVVGITENPESIQTVEGIGEIPSESLDVIREVQKLILWGESRDRGPFKERRVAGSQDILYPEAFKKDVLTKTGTLFPTMAVCVYKDRYHRTILWRFMHPAISNEKELK